MKDVVRAAQDLLIPRDKPPSNEFQQNGANFTQTLPGLFPLGDDFRKQGSVPELTRRRLLLSYNPAFGSCAQLIFLLFNQLQRHTALQVLAGYVRNTPASFKEFIELSADPNIKLRLEAAIANPRAVRREGVCCAWPHRQPVSLALLPCSPSRRRCLQRLTRVCGS